MIRLLLYCFLVLTSNELYAQLRLDNKLTQAHENIRGTKISLIAPDPFYNSDRFVGMEGYFGKDDDKWAAIQVQTYRQAFSMSSQSWDRKSLTSNGENLLDWKKVNTDEWEGILAEIESVDDKGVTKVSFRFMLGTATETIILASVVRSDWKKEVREIRKAFQSVVYEPGKKMITYGKILGIDVSDTHLFLSERSYYERSVKETMVFKDYGTSPDGKNYASGLVISNDNVKMGNEDREQFVLQVLRAIAENSQVKIEKEPAVQAIQVDGMGGYAADWTGIDSSGVTLSGYFIFLIGDDEDIYMIQAFSTDNAEGNFDKIKRAARTFHRKRTDSN